MGFSFSILSLKKLKGFGTMGVVVAVGADKLAAVEAARAVAIVKGLGEETKTNRRKNKVY